MLISQGSGGVSQISVSSYFGKAGVSHTIRRLLSIGEDYDVLLAEPLDGIGQSAQCSLKSPPQRRADNQLDFPLETAGQLGVKESRLLPTSFD